ncbi:hypothetical protein J7K70_02315 [bacterium]|nr:hypothetical protein [bacterium]
MNSEIKIDAKQKKKKRKLILLSLGIFTIVISSVLIVWSLTFLIKNINLVSKNVVAPQRNLRYDLDKVRLLFPQKP